MEMVLITEFWFKVIFVVFSFQTFTGSGTSKKKARLEAAESAVEALNLRVAGDVMVVKSGPDSEINFAADDLSLVMQESTGSGFVVSQPQAPAPVVKKVERIPEPIGKSPLLILNELRPGQQFEWRMPDGTLIKEKEEKEDRTQKFTVRDERGWKFVRRSWKCEEDHQGPSRCIGPSSVVWVEFCLHIRHVFFCE